MSEEFDQKCEALQALLRRYKKVVVAYSGGVDSGLVLKVASDILGPGRAIGVTAKSETLTDEEFEAAMKLAREQGFNIRTICYSELDIEGYRANPPDRCYFCKAELFEQLNAVAQEVGAEAILNGDNFDDIGDHRPGMLAAKKFHVVSPLKDARMTKADVRALARRLGLTNWDKPSAACLASRIPYGQPITAEKIQAVARGEKILRDLGCRQVRLRHHGEIARIEIGVEDIPRLFDAETRLRVLEGVKALGFAYVTLDLQGYRTGSMNETLAGRGEAAI